MSNLPSHQGFLFLAANTPWVYALAQSLASYGPVAAVRFYDWDNYRRLKPQWPEVRSDVHRVSIRMPKGYAGRLEPFFRPIMRRIIDGQRSRLHQISGEEPIVVCPYPYLTPWVRQIRKDKLVYYNLDDYILYDPTRASRITALEDELVERADLSICLSAHQAGALRARHVAKADNIEHFPLGVVDEFLNPKPDATPLPGTVGYVGNLGDRVDWSFFLAVAERLPAARFHIVGSITGTAGNARWEAARTRTLALPNIVYEGKVPQAEVRRHYWRYAVNWMPYDSRHPFNIASCPTKIMDALASGRPFVSTDIPEARRYPGRIGLVQTPDEAARVLQNLLDGRFPHDACEQVAYAAGQTWTNRAMRLLDLVHRNAGLASVAKHPAYPPLSHCAFGEQR